MTDFKYIGQSPVRRDALEKVTGEAKYTADCYPQGTLFGKVLGSPVAHARIKRIDTSRAEAYPGVVAVVTGADSPEERTIGECLADRHVLCREKVRYVGDFVAAVAAVDEETAEIATRLIDVEYEELPTIFDPEESFNSQDIIMHEGMFDYHHTDYLPWPLHHDRAHPNMLVHRQVRHGDIEKGFAEADLIVENRYVFPRASHCFMEPHSAVVIPKSNGELEVWASEQGGKLAKYDIAMTTGLTSSQVRLIIPYIGGGFGGKTGTPLVPIATILALKAHRPVHMVQSREEVFTSGNPRSPAIVYLKEGYRKDGTVCARQYTLYVNVGAYSTHAFVMINGGIYGGAGSYKNENYVVDSYGVYTNTPPTGPYRALGSELMVFAIERNMDKAAELLGIDSVEIRMKNLLENGDEDGHGQIVYNNATKAALKKAAEMVHWGEPRKPSEGPWVYGKGVAVGNKFTHFGETGTEATLLVHDDGTLELRNFHTELGQGAMTVDAQMVAEIFDIPVEKIKIINKDSQFCPYDEGTYCSRGTFLNGHAAILAAKDAKRQVLERASAIMRIPADLLDTKNAEVFEKAIPENRITFGQLFEFGEWSRDSAIIGRGTYSVPDGVEDGETGQGNKPVFYSYGAWGIEVKVNTETGEVRLVDCNGYYDAGRVVNPGSCTGQIEGAFSMGLGQAIFEETLINDKGRVINGSFRDYKIPTFMDTPRNPELKVGFVGDPNVKGPFGAKGVGEVAMIPVMPAVANAIRDAVGAELNELPLTRERVLNAIRKARKNKIEE